MDWVRAHYEKALLIGAALLLFLSSIFIWRNAARFGSTLAGIPPAPSLKSVSPLAKAEELAAAAAKLRQPPQWTFGGRSGIFVPEKYFIGANGQPATLQTTEIHPPVPNEWLEQFGLPIADADVLEQDPDGDGFTNLEEWQDQINTIDFNQPTQFLKVGDTIKGTRFKIAKFLKKYEPNKYGTNVDVSELTLEQEETKQQLTLVKEKVAISPESVATFVYTWGGRREFQVRKDQEFSLKPQEQIKYKLIDIGPAKAVIVNSQRADEPIEIGLLNQ